MTRRKREEREEMDSFFRDLPTELANRIYGVSFRLKDNYDEYSNVIDGITPFVGSGVTESIFGNLSTSKLIEYFRDRNLVADWVRHDLDHVAHYIDCTGNDSRGNTADYIRDQLDGVTLGKSKDDPLWVLAKLPFRTYITTNYDNLLERYLRRLNREPHTIVSYWNDWYNLNEPGMTLTKLTKEQKELITWPEDEKISFKKPVVFHLHGVASCKESMVLSINDYIDFMTALADPTPKGANDPSLLPPQVAEQIKNNNILFLGYSLKDINLHVILRRLKLDKQNTNKKKPNKEKPNKEKPNKEKPNKKNPILYSVQHEPNEKQVWQWVLVDRIESQLVKGNGTRNHNEVWDDLSEYLSLEKISKDQSMKNRIDEIKKYIENSLNNSNNQIQINTDLIWLDVKTFLKGIFFKLREFNII